MFHIFIQNNEPKGGFSEYHDSFDYLEESIDYVDRYFEEPEHKELYAEIVIQNYDGTLRKLLSKAKGEQWKKYD